MEDNGVVGNSLKSLKMRNRLLVLSFLRCAGPVSITEMARSTGLSKMTVHKIIDYYCDTGMVMLAGKGGSTEDGGKKPNLFAFNPNCYCVFSVRLGVDYFSASIVNLKGESMVTQRRIEFGNADFSEVMNRIGDTYHAQISDSGLRNRRFGHARCLAAVVGVNGIVDADKGVCFATHRNPKWGVHIPVRDSLRQRLPENVQVHVDSWWRHLAMGEILVRDPKGKKRFFLIGNAGDHIAGGLVAEGRVARGANGLAGEIGHIVVDHSSTDTCVCGGYGCLETAVAPSRMAVRALKMRDEYPDSQIFTGLDSGGAPLPIIAGAAERGDGLARELIQEAAGNFAVAINNVVQICDPGSIIMYGDYAAAGDFFMSSLKDRLDRMSLLFAGKKIQIERSGLDDEYGLLGAAHFVADSLCNGTLERL